LHIPRKAPKLSDSEDGEKNSFGNLMFMMMMHLKNGSEQREREFRICWKEMLIACEEACDQRNMMNMMFMIIMNKNGGETATHHLAPTPATAPAPTTLRIYLGCILVLHL
jgi:hypothetical protein